MSAKKIMEEDEMSIPEEVLGEAIVDN